MKMNIIAFGWTDRQTDRQTGGHDRASFFFFF